MVGLWWDSCYHRCQITLSSVFWDSCYQAWYRMSVFALFSVSASVSHFGCYQHVWSLQPNNCKYSQNRFVCNAVYSLYLFCWMTVTHYFLCHMVRGILILNYGYCLSISRGSSPCRGWQRPANRVTPLFTMIKPQWRGDERHRYSKSGRFNFSFPSYRTGYSINGLIDT